MYVIRSGIKRVITKSRDRAAEMRDKTKIARHEVQFSLYYIYNYIHVNISITPAIFARGIADSEWADFFRNRAAISGAW